MGILAKVALAGAGVAMTVGVAALIARWMKPCYGKGHIPRRHPQGYFTCDRLGCESKVTELSKWKLLDDDYIDTNRFYKAQGAGKELAG